MFLVTMATMLLPGQATLAEDSPEKFMEVKLILSDSEILTNDGLAYKINITNVTRSTIYIATPTMDPRYKCVIERKEAGGDWREIWNYPHGSGEPGFGALIKVSAGSTWAEYGQVFLTNKDGKFDPVVKSYVFGKPGKCELRARVKSAIGSYVSDSVPLRVKLRPKEEEPLDKRFEPYGHLYLDMRTFGTTTESPVEYLQSFVKRHPSGGVGKTLQLMLAFYSYVESREVAGKVVTWSEAFKALSVGLDEVRHDQLAFLLTFGAMKNKQWKDVAFLIEQVKEDCSSWVSRKSELETAIRRGEFPAP